MLKRKRGKLANQTTRYSLNNKFLLEVLGRICESYELPPEYLNTVEIRELTGYIRYSAQMAWLTANGIPFTRCADARVKVLKTDVEVRLGLAL